MLYLLWAIINIGVFILIIAAAIKTVKLIKERVGVIAAIVFIVGVFSIIGGFASSEEDVNKNSSMWTFNSMESTEMYSRKFTVILLQNNLISKYGLDIAYGISKEDQTRVPINAHSFTSGLSSGTKWIPTSAIVNTTDDNKNFQYEVDGVVEWRLMGFLIYSQSKTFRGTTVLR